MNLSEWSRNIARRRWVKIGLVVVVSLSALTYVGTHIKQHNEAFSIAKGATIEGFSQTAVRPVIGGGEETRSSAVAYFVGPAFVGPAPRPDVVSVMKVPTIELRPDDTKIGTDGKNSIIARGERRDGCSAWVQFIPMSWPDSPSPEWNLTLAQLSDIKSGNRVLASLDVVNCGWSRRWV